MDKKENYRDKLEAQLKEWKSSIEMLETKAAKTAAETKAEVAREIEVLWQKKWQLRRS